MIEELKNEELEIEYQVDKTLRFCAGHRLLNHKGLCRHMHGHNYKVVITAVTDELNELGMVVDFSLIKEKIGGWIDKYWDHAFLYSVEDEQVKQIMRIMGPDHKSFEMPWNPTAENMARFLLCNVSPSVMRGTGISIIGIQVQETETGAAACYVVPTGEERRAD